MQHSDAHNERLKARTCWKVQRPCDQRAGPAVRGQLTATAHCCGLLLISHWSINPKGTRILGEKKVKRHKTHASSSQASCRVSLATNQSMTGQMDVVVAVRLSKTRKPKQPKHYGNNLALIASHRMIQTGSQSSTLSERYHKESRAHCAFSSLRSLFGLRWGVA